MLLENWISYKNRILIHFDLFPREIKSQFNTNFLPYS